MKLKNCINLQDVKAFCTVCDLTNQGCDECIEDDCLPCQRGNKSYPPFTAEKQLELLCFLINFGVKITMQECNIPIKTENIANNLAGITNDIWKDLTESEKAEIKRILENEQNDR